ncbi:ATP-binding protein [Butyrivibrio sp. FCS014]|uniref:ATP-binding protein n=1 Tax=Butyrivibrio sp. FCS014 TaxID=1408304 RepID=UPI000466C929|nr:ATP-binding protein [Butyrivibrio sp. FCS014]
MDYRDFFDAAEENEVFLSGLDSTCAYLRWYDMFLEAAMEKQEGENEDELKEEIRTAARILGNRVALSQGVEVSASYGLSIVNVAAEYGLYDFSFFCLLMALSQEMDGNYKKGHAEISVADGQGIPTFALAKEIYSATCSDEQLIDALQVRNAIEGCPLFGITRSSKSEGSLFDSFELNRQLVSLLMGDYELPLGLRQICLEEAGLGDEKLVHHKKDVAFLKAYLNNLDDDDQKAQDSGTVIQISGKDGSGRKEFALAALGSDRSCLLLDFPLLGQLETDNINETVNEALVRARLLAEDMIITAYGDYNASSLKIIIQRSLEQLKRVFILTDEKAELQDLIGEAALYKVSLKLPSASEQEDIWQKCLDLHSVSKEVSAGELAAKYRLMPGAIKECVELAAAKALSLGKRAMDSADITTAVLEKTTSALDELSDRIPLKFGWDDLIVEQSQKEVMELLVSRVKNRNKVDEEWGFEEKIPYGKGVSLILYGPPGTGKTMAAQVMAKEIGMALYRVDLSQMVDKYVGETEKNIGKIFDAASDGNVILFFDEADALFSRRTEVTSSNDKHANTEVAYLLQKIEQHDGITFLATNRFKDFDQAFVRRITYAVKMDKPDADRRLQLFSKILPDKTPRDKDLDLKYFADSFELSGSEIKEVIYSAAFIAAAEGKNLGNKHLSRAIRYQQEKSGKMLQGTEFTRYLT